MNERTVMEIPKIKARRPYADNEPNGYRESDNDFIQNNLSECVWFLENRDKLMLIPGMAQEPTL